MSTLHSEKSRDALATLRISREPRHRPPDRSKKWVLVLFVLVLAVAAGGFYASQNDLLSQSPEWIPDAIRSRTEVRVAPVVVETGRSADAVVVATGYVQSFQQANIGARAAGRIESIHVEEGSPVKVGQIIAVLDHKDIDAALAAAKASLTHAKAELAEHDVAIARAKKDYDRNVRLRQSNSLPESDFDKSFFDHQAAVTRRATMEASVTLAEARVQESEQFRENMFVRAPFDGTVISKDAEVGESILPGGMGEASGRGSVVTIADLEHLEVDCDVKEDYISRVKNGSPTEVAVDAVPDRRYSGRVRKVIPMGDRARATIKVKVEIIDADERLFPEMSATVYFLTEPGEKSADAPLRRVFCDSQALVSVGEQTVVWTVGEDLKAQKIPVTTGVVQDSRTEIVEGLTGGERVIVAPPKDLQVGQLVKTRE